MRHSLERFSQQDIRISERYPGVKQSKMSVVMVFSDNKRIGSGVILSGRLMITAQHVAEQISSPSFGIRLPSDLNYHRVDSKSKFHGSHLFGLKIFKPRPDCAIFSLPDSVPDVISGLELADRPKKGQEIFFVAYPRLDEYGDRFGISTTVNFPPVIPGYVISTEGGLVCTIVSQEQELGGSSGGAIVDSQGKIISLARAVLQTTEITEFFLYGVDFYGSHVDQAIRHLSVG